MENLKIVVTYGVTFESMVTNHIPMLTLENNVVNDGKIIQFTININSIIENLFFDYVTGEFCYSAEVEENSELLYDLGNMIQSHFYKYSSIEEFLQKENQQAMLDDVEEEVA